MDKIIKIQKMFIKKKLFKNIEENKNIIYQLNILINNKEDAIFIKSNNENYDIVTNYIQKKEIINSISLIFQLLYRYYKIDNTISKKISAKEFLISYLFIGFPKISLNDKITQIEQDMYFFSKLMLEQLNKLLNDMNDENLRKWIKTLNQYSNVLLLFMYSDKIKKANELSLKWNELHKVLDDIQQSNKYTEIEKQNITNILKDEIKINELIIKQLIPNFEISNLYNLKYITNIYEKIFQKCFWDDVEKNINNCEYTIILNLFNDIKKEISILTTSTEILKNLHEIIDISYIKQLLDNNCFDLSFILNISIKIINYFLIYKLYVIRRSSITSRINFSRRTYVSFNKNS